MYGVQGVGRRVNLGVSRNFGSCFLRQSQRFKWTPTVGRSGPWMCSHAVMQHGLPEPSEPSPSVSTFFFLFKNLRSESVLVKGLQLRPQSRAKRAFRRLWTEGLGGDFSMPNFMKYEINTLISLLRCFECTELTAAQVHRTAMVQIQDEDFKSLRTPKHFKNNFHKDWLRSLSLSISRSINVLSMSYLLNALCPRP